MLFVTNLSKNVIFNQGAIMLYKIEMNDWEVEITMEADDFQLLAEIQCAIESTLENYRLSEEFDMEDEEDEVSYTLVAKKK